MTLNVSFLKPPQTTEWGVEGFLQISLFTPLMHESSWGLLADLMVMGFNLKFNSPRYKGVSILPSLYAINLLKLHNPMKASY